MDLSYISIHKLVHRFSQAATTNRATLAVQALAIMDQCGVLHPAHQEMMRVANDPRYSAEWAATIAALAKNFADKATGYTYDTAGNDTDLMDEFVGIFRHFYVEGDFASVTYYANLFQSLIQFRTQFADAQLLGDNRSFEFLFHQSLLHFSTQLFGPQEKEERSDLKRDSKLAGNSLKKAAFLFQKNEALLTQHAGGPTSRSNSTVTPLEPDHGLFRELRFYWLIRWVAVLHLFKQNKPHEFLEQFHAVADANSYIPDTTTLQILTDLALDTEVALAVGLTCIQAKPFKELQFCDNQALADLVACDQLMDKLLGELVDARPPQARAVLSSPDFSHHLHHHIGYLLPESKAERPYLSYIQQMVDFKFFLLILSITKQIPRAKMFATLGIPADDPSFLNELLLLLATINRPELNYGYDVKNEIFYNHPPDPQRKQALVARDVARLEHQVEAESLANLMKGVLTDRFFQ